MFISKKILNCKLFTNSNTKLTFNCFAFLFDFFCDGFCKLKYQTNHKQGKVMMTITLTELHF